MATIFITGSADGLGQLAAKALIAQGKTIDDVVAANPSKDYDPVWASYPVGPEAFASMVYQSLTRRDFDWRQDPPAQPR